MEVIHRPFAPWGEVADHGRPSKNCLQLGQPKIDLSLNRECQQMQNAVGRASHGRHRHCSILKRFSCKDIPRADFLFQKIPDCCPDAQTFLAFSRSFRRNRTAVGQHQSNRLKCHAPSIERSRDTTSPWPRACRFQNLFCLLFGHVANHGCGLRIIDIQNGRVLPAMASRPNTSSADYKSRVVHPGQGHGKTRTIFIAMVKSDHRVVVVGSDHTLGTIGDQIP